ncbi:MAG: HDOD domain-containing protein, partial [Oceanococcaceae bacterium]
FDQARRAQLALGDRGAVTTVRRGWSIGVWVVDEDVPEQLLDRLAEAESNGASLILARLTVAAPIKDANPAAICAQLSGRECLRLSTHEFLLFCPPGGSQGAASWIKAVASRLRLGLVGQPDIHASLAFCPDQGRTLADLHNHFHDRAENAVNRAPRADMKCFAVPGQSWPVAGSAWREVLALGEDNATSELPANIADYVRSYWPADPEATRHFAQHATPRIERCGRNILRNFSLGGESRRQTRSRILQKVRALRDLPSLPVMAMQAYKLAQSPDSNAEQLARFVEREPALSARILGVVNSPHFGLNASVESIRHAIVLLGWEEISQISLMLSSKTVFSRSQGVVGKELWEHAVRAAEVARHLARRVPDVSVSRMYTAALLHDVGKVCLHMVAADAMQECRNHARQAGVPTYEMERERLGLDHAELSGMMLRHWGLPETLCEIIERHHGCWPGEQGLPVESALLGLVDHITHRLEGSERHGDLTRIHRVHAHPLEPHFGAFSNITIDLLADDLQPQLRAVAA